MTYNVHIYCPSLVYILPLLCLVDSRRWWLVVMTKGKFPQEKCKEVNDNYWSVEEDIALKLHYRMEKCLSIGT